MEASHSGKHKILLTHLPTYGIMAMVKNEYNTKYCRSVLCRIFDVAFFIETCVALYKRREENGKHDNYTDTKARRAPGSI